MASGVTIINPLTLSRGSALETGPFSSTGEVRHFSPDDAADPHAWSNPTRQLAQRDNLVADKLNEVINTVNNKEQYINLPTIRTTLSPGSSEVITNYRIPSGFEARVFNAIVSATPTGGARLEIYHNAGSYGLSSGTNVVSTADEFSGGTTFWATGEFVIKLFNDGTVTADVVASIILTMRPVGPQAGGIIGPGAEGARGPKGDPGPQGAIGPQGIPGATGTPGMVWEGIWNGSTTYVPGDVVRYADGGAPGYSSYISKLTGINQLPPAYPGTSNTYWDIVAESGATGPAGATGPQGPTGSGVGIPGPQGPIGSTGPIGPVGVTYMGSYSITSSYSFRDFVNAYTVTGSGTIGRSFYANASIPVGVSPLSPSGTNWIEFFGPSILPQFNSYLVSGSYYKDASYVAGPNSGVYYGTPTIVSGVGAVSMSCYERAMESDGGGIVHLMHKIGLNFAGKITGYLPNKLSNGATIDWITDQVNINVCNHGTLPLTLGIPYGLGSNIFTVDSSGTIPQKMVISINGVATYTV